MEDYYSGEYMEITCSKCGKKEMTLISSLEDKKAKPLCGSCERKIITP